MSTPETIPRKLTTKEVAEQLGWNYHTLRNYLRKGFLRPAEKIGHGDLLWSQAEIDRVVEFRATNKNKGGRPPKKP